MSDLMLSVQKPYQLWDTTSRGQWYPMQVVVWQDWLFILELRSLSTIPHGNINQQHYTICTLLFLSRALATQRSCRSPTEKFSPFSVTSEWSEWGSWLTWGRSKGHKDVKGSCFSHVKYNLHSNQFVTHHFFYMCLLESFPDLSIRVLIPWV